MGDERVGGGGRLIWTRLYIYFILFIECLSLMNFYCKRSRSHRGFYLS